LHLVGGDENVTHENVFSFFILSRLIG